MKSESNVDKFSNGIAKKATTRKLYGATVGGQTMGENDSRIPDKSNATCVYQTNFAPPPAKSGSMKAELLKRF